MHIWLFNVYFITYSFPVNVQFLLFIYTSSVQQYWFLIVLFSNLITGYLRFSFSSQSFSQNHYKRSNTAATRSMLQTINISTKDSISTISILIPVFISRIYIYFCSLFLLLSLLPLLLLPMKNCALIFLFIYYFFNFLVMNWCSFIFLLLLCFCNASISCLQYSMGVFLNHVIDTIRIFFLYFLYISFKHSFEFHLFVDGTIHNLD